MVLLSCGRTEQEGYGSSDEVDRQQSAQSDTPESLEPENSVSNQTEMSAESSLEVDSKSGKESPDEMNQQPGGAAATIGVGGMTSGVEPREDCRSVSGGGEKPWFDLLVKGSGFTDENGVRVRVISQVEDGYRFGLGDAVIREGEFQIGLKQSLNDGRYVNISVYLDRDRNERCDEGEDLLDHTTGIIDDDYQIDLSPLKLCTPEFGGSCSPRSEPAGSCNANGFDLTQILTCE